MRFFKFAKLLICLAFLCVCPVLVYADVSCPTGYVKISEPDSIIVTNASSCPSGHTKLSDMSGNTSVTNCTTGLSSGFCTYYSEPCQSGKYFDGTTHKTCIAGSYCDGSGTATPGVSGCSKACPENSTSTSGATKCTCNTGYEMIGGACVLKTCESGYYLNGNECTVCPVGSYCANNIKTACDDGYTTDATGATDVSQCYTTCEQQCTQQTCPDNATCTHGTAITTGKQYVGGTCDAEQTMCEVNFECNENFELVDGVCKLVPEFTIITTDMPAGTKFQLSVAATGTFYIDWGDGTVTMNTYSHTYKDSGARTIGMAGQATQYGGYRLDGAIEFLSNPYIETVQGSLGAIFGTLADGKNPTFQKTFLGCTGLKNVSEDLFSGITGGAESMFYMTFALCTSLKSIPENLFAGINSNAMDLYWRTFEGCTALESIPDGLFSSNTITGVHTFRHTFKNCTSLKTIPVGLFKNITAVTQGVFYETFLGCTGLNNIPSDLFVNIKNTAAVAFFGTFSGCTGLTELPNGLFRNIEGKPVWADFGSTFENCTGLEGYIPNDMFKKLDSINFDATTMSNIFANTGLDTKCPSDTYQYITGFESAWSNKVMCGTCPDGTLSIAGSVGIESCKKPEPVEVIITTTEMLSNSEFVFYLSASGTFFVDWGDGTIEIIEHPTVKTNRFSHRYSTAGVYKIGLSGSATGYADSYCVGFMGNQYVNEVDGSLIDVFGILSDGTNPKFTYSFTGCGNLSKISKDLFAGYNGGTKQMFNSTFSSTYSLKEIPEGLFDSITTAAPDMFNVTFASSGLTSLPSGMFKNITGKPESNMFLSTFHSVKDLQGYVPANMFENMDSVDYESGPMSTIFYGTNLAEQCPENMYQYKTGFEVDWSDKVACSPCPDGTTSFAGASGIEQCTGPKSLYIGDDIQMNLTTVKPQTARVMVFDVLGELYYGGLSDTPKSINKNTDKQFRILDGDTTYWMHDYTVK